MEEMSYVFSFTFFSLPPGLRAPAAAYFHIALVAASILILSPTMQNFHVVLSTKKFLLRFLSLALDKISVALFLVELRWPAAYFPFISVFVLLYISNLWK